MNFRHVVFTIGLAGLIGVGCGSNTDEAGADSDDPGEEEALRVALQSDTQDSGNSGGGTVSDPFVHYGMCDASAAIAVGGSMFLAANDEDNVLRLYKRDSGGRPLEEFDLDGFLDIIPDSPEADLEAVATLSNRVYWISSHGRNKDGEFRPNRHRFFAAELEVDGDGVRLNPVGKPCKKLLETLLRAPQLARFELEYASAKAPKDKNGLNIEGLCVAPDGDSLLIGFRNPIPGGKALVVPLLNPAAVVTGAEPELGEPMLLELDGLGIRDFIRRDGKYLIIAGGYDGDGELYLYTWRGGDDAPERVPGFEFDELTPEAVFYYPGRPEDEYYLLSDDGSREIDGVECKDLKDPMERRFRSFRIRLDSK
ncbi:MAG: DUF3616 domain-containing protein [Verrucomicrobia bacterium]|nr:DUF3616 domain-containing protein [Verrucomicrobiota bacterium]MCF7709212.1 DUF3616 domain-containing protein [Verrucomicrobiota bacterium]